MKKNGLLLSLFLPIHLLLHSQAVSIERLIADSSMRHASVSLKAADISTGEVLAEYNSKRSLSQASVMKLVTTAAALEMLGPGHRFRTIIGYRGELKRRSGVLKGDIIITGGGDPCLGSERFIEYYGDFTSGWIEALKSAGIRKVTGRVITDDTYYDFQPVPGGWPWEDIGNYYGAGVYGLSVFDNTIKIHFRTGPEGTRPEMLKMEPLETMVILENNLVSSGSSDQGYVFLAPYSTAGWISGRIPAGRDDFVLKASIPDPPLLMAEILTSGLKDAGIEIKNQPSTARLYGAEQVKQEKVLHITESPPLSAISEIINHESVNLYAEHLVKELGKKFMNQGSTDAGAKVIISFLEAKGIDCNGLFIMDGSGLSPQNALNSEAIAALLIAMRKNTEVSEVFYNSLPEAGKEGTLKNVFRDRVFEGRMRAKSGTLARVRSYAGYITTLSGRELAFSIIINNYTGPQAGIVNAISDILKELVTNY